MEQEKTISVETLYKILCGQRFADWYEHEFVEHIEGGDNAKTKTEILGDLARMS